MATNDITGDKLITKTTSDSYRNGWDRIFGKKDSYDNPLDGSSLPNCCYPDCGCDGARNCIAESGANNASMNLNLDKT